MKKTCLGGILLALALAPAALADTITLHRLSNTYFSDGGEIQAVTSPTQILGYSRVAGSFQTFCIESGITLNLGVPYTYTMTQTDHSGNTLKLGTAWLFANFSAQTLAPTTYDYGANAANVTDAGLLQGAIWFFQGQTPTQDAAGFDATATNPYVLDAIGALGGTLAGAMVDANGAYGVNVLNLNDANGAPVQDLLGLVTPSVPDGGTTVALLGFALVGVESLRRRFAR